MTGDRIILVVDDEPVFRMRLANALRTLGPGLRIEQAGDGLEALAILESGRVDLLVTDIHMPHMDGLTLLRKLFNRRYEIPTIIVTALETEEIQKQARELGVVRVLDKPVDLDALFAAAEELLEPAPNSTVRGFTLPGFVQLIHMEKKTCVLRVTSAGRLGSLAFEDGALVHAEDGARAGEEAAMSILTWEDTTIQMVARPAAGPKTVKSPLAHLLLEAMRILDERQRRNRSSRSEAPPTGDELDDLAGLAESRPPPRKSDGPPGVSPLASAPPPDIGPSAAAVQEALADCMRIEGAIGAALGDWRSGRTLGETGGKGRVSMEVAASANCHVMRAKLQAIDMLGIRSKLEDILVMFEDQLHIVRPLRALPGLFFYLAVDRTTGNLALARRHLERIEAQLGQ